MVERVAVRNPQFAKIWIKHDPTAIRALARLGRRAMSFQRTLDVLRQLSRNEVLEYQSRKYFLRGELVPTWLARRLVGKGFVEPPPTLFAPVGGRLTELGLAELNRLEI